MRNGQKLTLKVADILIFAQRNLRGLRFLFGEISRVAGQVETLAKS